MGHVFVLRREWTRQRRREKTPTLHGSRPLGSGRSTLSSSGASASSSTSSKGSWTLLQPGLFSTSHAFVTFVTWHWMKGTPFAFNQGEYDDLTQWEQIDDGEQFTTTRKFFTATPVVLFLISCHYAHFSTTQFAINVVAVGFCLIPKLPYMHKKRILGINKD